jgi:hypothetical protein
MQANWPSISKKKVDEIFIDATEREHCRPKDEVEQKALYSGKQGYHTIKNTVICDKSKFIHFLGLSTQGSMHDYALLKFEFPPEQDWFIAFNCAVDAGYQGFASDYKTKGVKIPIKKTPKQPRTEQERAHNTAVAKVRIVIEHAIGGIKRFQSLVVRYRNRIEGFEDTIIRIAAGLWNLHLTFGQDIRE